MSFARCYGVFENSINDICDEMGFLYNFESAKNACPEGFHLPRKDELEEFIRKVGENDSRRLKTQTGWKEQYNGTNSLGFSANGAGYFHNAANGYDLELEYLGLWSSTQEGMDNAYVLAINRNLPISIEIDDIDDGYSIRCIRD